MQSFAALYDRLGYRFQDPAHLECALTHRSAHKAHNERLEFLGDAVLNLVITDEIYRHFPQADEGDLSRMRAQLVNGETLGDLAGQLALGDYLRLGGGELKSGGFRRRSILADAVEAIIGAIYLDGGMVAARDFVRHLYADVLAKVTIADIQKDPKTQLQEILQARGLALPVYTVIDTHGQAHNQVFDVECQVPMLAVPVRARGNSRRKAEQAAAQRVLELLGESIQ